MPWARSFFLHLFEKIVIGVPGFGDVLHRIAGLLDQRAPDMVRPHGASIGYRIIAAPFLDAVVAVAAEQRGLGVFRFLRLDDIGGVDQLVVPGIERENFDRVVREQNKSGTTPLVIAETIF